MSASRLFIVVWCGVALLALTPVGVCAQSLPDTLNGRRVRVHLSHQKTEGHVRRQLLRGTAVSVQPDSLVVQLHPAAEPLGIALNGIYRVDVSRGVSRGRSAFGGAIGGAFFWGLLGLAIEEPVEDDRWESAGFAAAVGFIAGAVSGALFPKEDWKRVFSR
jgi:hypothetical protein